MTWKCGRILNGYEPGLEQVRNGVIDVNYWLQNSTFDINSCLQVSENRLCMSLSSHLRL